MAKLM